MNSKNNSSYPQRKSIRYQGYDYSSDGVYFVTLVTHKWKHLFGSIENGVMRLNDFGVIVKEEWFKTKVLRPNIELFEDEFVAMPNHIHGIIWIVEPEKERTDENNNAIGFQESWNNGDYTGTARRARTTGKFGHPIKGSLPTIIGAYKAAVTKRINLQRGTHAEPVWLRNYYEHIIDTEKEYFNIANYIHDNPENWGANDEYFSRDIDY